MKTVPACLWTCLLCALLTLPAAALGDDVDLDSGGADTAGAWSDSGGTGADSGSDTDSTYTDTATTGSATGRRGLAGDLLFFGLLAYLILRPRIQRRRQARQAAEQGPPAAPPRDPDTLKQVDAPSLERLQAHDPAYSPEEVEREVGRWVREFESAWCAGDMTPCQGEITPAQFQRYQNQLESMRQAGERSQTDEIRLLKFAVERWIPTEGEERLLVWMQLKKRTYKVDRNDPARILKGRPQVVYILDYRWHLVRPPAPPGTPRGFTWSLDRVDKLFQETLNA